MEDFRDYRVDEGDQNDKDVQAAMDSVSPEDMGAVQGDNDASDVKSEEATYEADESKPKKDVPKEEPIEFLLNPDNRKVFEATPALLARKDLIPCDKDGKKVYDHRVF